MFALLSVSPKDMKTVKYTYFYEQEFRTRTRSSSSSSISSKYIKIIHT